MTTDGPSHNDTWWSVPQWYLVIGPAMIPGGPSRNDTWWSVPQWYLVIGPTMIPGGLAHRIVGRRKGMWGWKGDGRGSSQQSSLSPSSSFFHLPFFRHNIFQFRFRQMGVDAGWQPQLFPFLFTKLAFLGHNFWLDIFWVTHMRMEGPWKPFLHVLLHIHKYVSLFKVFS